MSNNGAAVSAGAQLPKEFFTGATFGTLGGCALVTWVVSGVLSGVFETNPKIVGLIVSIVVAYVALIVSREKRMARYLVGLFNGFLIYATVVGGTSFLPYINSETANVVQDEPPSVKTALVAPWIPDPNLVVAAKTLLEMNDEQAKALGTADGRIDQITRSVERPGGVSPQERASLLRDLSKSKTEIQTTKESLKPSILKLEKVGVKVKSR
jgi:hypothetical protein